MERRELGDVRLGEEKGEGREKGERGKRKRREAREGREGRTRGKERESGERGKEVRHTHNWVNIPLAAKKILFTLPYTHQHNYQTYPN